MKRKGIIEMIVDLDTRRKYDVIYADPPWEYWQSGSKRNSRGGNGSLHKSKCGSVLAGD